MLRVLVCDDDSTTRFLLKRFLTRELPCTVAEADNGVAAIRALANERFDLLILDLNMPVMNGHQTLQVIRDTPGIRGVPVVVLTAEKDEHEVQQIIKLGVHAFVLKPVAQERAQARLRDVLACLESRARSSRTASVGSGTILEAGQPLLVADGDENFRHMVVSTLGRRFKIVEASNGTDALDAAIKGAISCALVGRRLLEPDALAARLRGLETMAARVIAIAPRAEIEAVRATGLYDAVIARTFIPDVFERQIDELLRTTSSSPLPGARDLVSALRGNVVTAVQQLFGMVMKMDAEPLPELPDELDGPFYRGDIHVRLDDRYDIAVSLVCDQASANAFSKAMSGTGAPEDVLGEMANIVAGRVTNAMTSRNVKAGHDRAVVKQIVANHAVPADGDSLALNFGVTRQAAYLSVLCTIVETGRDVV